MARDVRAAPILTTTRILPVLVNPTVPYDASKKFACTLFEEPNVWLLQHAASHSWPFPMPGMYVFILPL